METRKHILESLLYLPDPASLEKIRAALSVHALNWNDAPLAMLTEDMVISVLERYLEGRMTAKQVEDWAWAIEGREDVLIGDEDGDNEAIFLALAELANPATEGDLTPESARAMIARLSG